MNEANEVIFDGMKFLLPGSMLGALILMPFVRLVGGFWPYYWSVVVILFFSGFWSLVLEAFFLKAGLFDVEKTVFSSILLLLILSLFIQSSLLSIFLKNDDSIRLSFGKAMGSSVLCWVVMIFAWLHLFNF